MSSKTSQKREKRKRAAKKKAHIRLTALKQEKKQKGFHVSDRLFKRMTSRHQDLLQNIEYALVSACRMNSEIDDAVIAEVLKAAIKEEASQDERVVWIMDHLDDIHQMRSDISDDLWKDGLRVVLDSVYNHSDARPGSTGYLDFVSKFIL